MDIEKIHRELENLANAVKATIRASMERNGVNPRSNKNTLSESDLYKELQSDAIGYELIRVLIHDYYVYINDGSKYTTKPPPVEAIRNWCRESGLKSDNSVVFAIREAIFQRGIEARPFMDEAWSDVDKLFDGFADRILNILLEDIDAVLS